MNKLKKNMKKKTKQNSKKSAGISRSALRKEETIRKNEEILVQEGKEILEEEKIIDTLEHEVEKKERAILRHEHKIAHTEEELLKKEELIRQEAQKILHKVHEPPLRKVSRMDINKGVIGAFFGLVSHFAFLSSGRVIDAITLPRAFLILVMSYTIGYIMIERTGFRAIQEQRYLKIIPARVTVIYLTSLIVSLFVLILFDQLHDFHLDHLIKTLAVTSLLAIPGAAGAHMIGHKH